MIDVLELPGARAIFSTRQGGVSEGPYSSLNLGALTDDEPDRVTENRARLAREAEIDAERVVMGWQVHGTDVQDWDAPDPKAVYVDPGGTGFRPATDYVAAPTHTFSTGVNNYRIRSLTWDPASFSACTA